ncbi:MAG: GNAT family N-acetyltransferase [bacterium]
MPKTPSPDSTIRHTLLSWGSELYLQALLLRESELRTPIGLSLVDEDLSHEPEMLHFGSVNPPNKLAAYLQIASIGPYTARMRQVVVAPTLRNCGIGSALLQHCEGILRHIGYREIQLNARHNAIHFYEKHDFKAYGTPFVEVGIPHTRMSKKLTSR